MSGDRQRRAGLLSGWLVLAALVPGCGAAGRPTPAPPVEGVLRRADGPDLSQLPRDTPGRLHLSLWIDAGSRDADPPQVATLTARLAARAGGPALQARVLPDGSELSLACSPEGLADCLRSLAQALAFRGAPPKALARVRAELADDRRRARAADPGRQADRLALQALLGEAAAGGMLPLGAPERDADADGAAVSDFARQHYGPRRALLVVAGDVPADGLDAALARSFAGAPAAASPRRARSLEVEDDAVVVGVGDAPGLALALTAPTLERAASLAEGVASALERKRMAHAVHSHAFSLRGGALALLRVHAPAPEPAVVVAAREHAWLRAEAGTGAITRGTASGLEALASRTGARWCAGGGGDAPAEALAVGAVMPGGRADRVEDDPDRALRERAQTRLSGAVAQGRRDASPAMTGDSAPGAARVRLDNGVRLFAEADRNGDEAAIALRFEPGAASDPPTLHGRAALLAMLTTTACAAYPRTALRTRLMELGARMTPMVSPDGWGLVLSLPAERWRGGLELALDCAIEPSFRRGDVVAARHRLRERQAHLASEPRMWAQAARQVSAAAPGAVAPWGDPAGLAGIDRRALGQLHRASARGPRLRVGIVAPDGVDAMVAHAARRLAGLPANALAEAAAPPATPTVDPRPADPGQPLSVVLGWSAEAPSGAAAGGQAFASALRSLLTSSGLPTQWHGGGARPGGGWAAVVVRLPASELPLIADRAAQLAQSLPGEALGALSRELWQRRERERAERVAAAAGPRALALSRPADPASPDAAAALATRLAAATPSVRVLR